MSTVTEHNHKVDHPNCTERFVIVADAEGHRVSVTKYVRGSALSLSTDLDVDSMTIHGSYGMPDPTGALTILLAPYVVADVYGLGDGRAQVFLSDPGGRPVANWVADLAGNGPLTFKGQSWALL